VSKEVSDRILPFLIHLSLLINGLEKYIYIFENVYTIKIILYTMKNTRYRRKKLYLAVVKE